MSDSIETRIGRSIGRLTLLERICQGQMCEAIEHFEVDADYLNSGIHALVVEVLEDLRPITNCDGTLLCTEVPAATE